MRVIDTIALSIRTSAQYNPDVEVRPSCILLPDRERQWWGIHRHLDAIYAYIALDSPEYARRMVDRLTRGLTPLATCRLLQCHHFGGVTDVLRQNSSLFRNVSFDSVD